MPIEQGTSTDVEAGRSVVAQIDGEGAREPAWLIVDETFPSDPVDVKKLDTHPGRLRLFNWGPDQETIEYLDMVYDKFAYVRLAAGLWDDCGPFTPPESHAVPVPVATAGTEYIAAWLRLGANSVYPVDRDVVADDLDVHPDTVSRYCSEVRWSPE